MKTVRLNVAPSHSTVNGSKVDRRHDAQFYLDGWRNLGIEDPRVYVDGKGSPWEYLHVPVLGPHADGKWYRVRCAYAKITARKKYKGRLVNSVRAEKYRKQWFWILETED